MHQQVWLSTTVRSAHTVLTCFVFIWEQTANCATCIINRLIFITEMIISVYSAERTGSLNEAVCALSLKGWRWKNIRLFRHHFQFNLRISELYTEHWEGEINFSLSITRKATAVQLQLSTLVYVIRDGPGWNLKHVPRQQDMQTCRNIFYERTQW
jgi:hypothetical protein